jgi:hypothetical protein
MYVAYWIAVYSGIKTENKCSVPAIQEFCDSKITVEKYKKIQEIENITYYTRDYNEAMANLEK